MTSPPLFSPPDTLDLGEQGTWPATRHEFDEASKWAIHAALASGRPLLLQGEPGIGKSQLARAAAEFLEVPFLPFVVNERSERDHLLYDLDTLGRLAKAQLAREGSDVNDIAEKCFMRPGVLWWALDWEGAVKQLRDNYFRDDAPLPFEKPEQTLGKMPPPCDAVVLIDEIDKADPSVPNGLLECMGNTGFDSHQMEKPVCVTGKKPLVVITTNGERELPAAFLRRCLVLSFPFPPKGSTAEAFLLGRARVHWGEEVIDGAFSNLIAKQIVPELLTRREEAEKMGHPKPGAAEFLDLIRVLEREAPAEREEVFAKTKDFTLLKLPLE